MRLPALIAAALAACATPGFAEIEKLATPCERELCFYWWPRLPPLEGWRHDREQSFQLRVNALAPEGEPFARAETVMYAKAIYKPRRPEATSLAKLIEADQGDFSKNVPGVR